MKKFPLIIKTMVIVVFITACSKVPLTDRKQLNLLPESQMVAMGLTSYSEFLKENPPANSSNPNTQLVKSVGEKIQTAVVKYMRDNKMYDRIKDYKWEFNLVES